MLRIEWELNPALGKQRLSKFLSKPESEAARSLALVLRWLRFLVFQEKPGPKPRVAPALLDFPLTVLDTSKSWKKTIKALKGPNGDPEGFLRKLEADVPLEFVLADEGELGELGEALTKLERDRPALVLLYAREGPGWHAVGVQNDKLGKPGTRIFEPYVGQLSFSEPDDVAEKLESDYRALDGFSVYYAERGESASKGAVLEWDFHQSRMFAALQDGELKAHDMAVAVLAMKDSLGCDGVCLAMTFDWLKSVMAKKPISSGRYFEATKFSKLALKQVHLKDELEKLAPIALSKGYVIDVPSTTPDKADPKDPLMGYFSGKTDEFAKKLGHLEDGFYFLAAYGAEGHVTGLQKTGTTGKFFDSNVGQWAVYPGGETLSQLVEGIFRSVYADDVKAAKNPKNPWTNSYFFSRVVKK